MVDAILDWLFLAAIISSALVATFKPKKGSFFYKLFGILNYISIRNPRGTITIPIEDYEQLKGDSNAEHHHKDCGCCDCRKSDDNLH